MWNADGQSRLTWINSLVMGLCLLGMITPNVPAQKSTLDLTEEDEVRLFLRRYWSEYEAMLKPIEIFDPMKGEELAQIRAATEEMARQAHGTPRHTLDEIQHLQTYDYDLQGATEEDILALARLRALKSAAARVYFNDYYLLGLDLLEPYLARVGNQFIARTSVENRQILANNQLGMKVRISVNLDDLYRDLREKRFIAEPNLRPILAVHLQELIDNQPDDSAGGRRRIEQMMQNNLFVVNSKYMEKPPLDVDLSSSPDLLKEARLEAQRQNVDVLITGRLAIQPVSQEEIFYDDFAFQEADIHLKMYRVDTGELIDEITDQYSASGPDVKQATANALDAMIDRVAKNLAGKLQVMWPNTMLSDDNYRLLLSGVSEEELLSITFMLKTLSPDLTVYQKAYLGDVAVLNINFPNSKPQQLEQFLRQAAEPQFIMHPVGKRRWELDVL